MMASARASNPQTWNRYTYTLNNPLRFIDPDGLEVPESCAKDPNCTIKIKVNVIYDKGTNNGKGLTPEQKQKLEREQLAKAQKDFGTSNIQLDIGYSAGTFKRSGMRVVEATGFKTDSLNLLVSADQPGFAAGTSFVTTSDVAMSIVNINEANEMNLSTLWTNTTEHEFGHQFLGDVYQKMWPGLWSLADHFIRDYRIDSMLNSQSVGFFQQDFREGVKQRQYAVPLNPEANKPRQ
jgi:hypothetical protein